MDKSSHTTINVQLLANLADCLTIQKTFNPLDTDAHKQLQQQTEQALSAVGNILSQAIGGPQNFSAGTVGEHVVDGTKSSFL